MTAITDMLQTLGALAPPLLGSLWRTSVDGILFALLIVCICRLLPRLPAAGRFWLWWLVSAKLLMGLVLTTPSLPFANPLVVRLPAQHPATAPAFFVARMAVQPARFLYGPAATSSAHVIGTKSAPAGAAANSDFADPSATTPSSLRAATEAQRSGIGSLQDLWHGLAQAAALLWCAGFILRLGRIGAGFQYAQHIQQMSLPCPDATQQEAVVVARLVGLCHLPSIVVWDAAVSPFLSGLLRPVIVLPGPAQTPLTAAEMRMALAHELIHLRRKDLWLALIPALAEAIFFFLPVARWAARECDACREEVCDSTAIALLGKEALADYGQLLLKVTLAAQAKGCRAPQMGMAVTSTPAFLQLRRRLNALRATVISPAGPSLHRAAALLVTICLPGILPWHLRALPRSSAVELGPTGNIFQHPEYTVVDLGTLGGKVSDAYDIGDDGTVVGTANVFPMGGRGHAFSWRPNADTGNTGKMTDLCEGSVYRHSLAYSVNASGQIAAAAFNNSLKPSAFLWTPGDGQRQRRYLGTLPGFHYSRAAGINDEGVVVGAALDTNVDQRGATRMRAFSWQNGKLQDLGTLGGSFSAATAISQAGHVVGKSDTRIEDGLPGSPSPTHAALWEPGSVRAEDLGTLSGGANSAASAVNRLGQVVGYSESSDAPRHAFLYTDHVMTDLGSLPASDPYSRPISVASGINDRGYVVGTASSVPVYTDAQKLQESSSRAVLWLPTGASPFQRRLVDLNACLAANNYWTLESARAINNHGEIVGVGRIDGKKHAFLLKPLPAPNE